MIPRSLKLAALLSLSALSARAENISPLGDRPDWSSLEKYQETITRDEFSNGLTSVYCTRGVSPDFIRVDPDSARILIDEDAQTFFTLRFAADAAARKSIASTWHPARALARAKPGKELAGLKIALDPGHLGGAWAKMEERWFQVGDSKPVQEGDMTLLVAKLLAPKLRARGAIVSLVRDKLEPVTSKRPDDFKEIARQILARAGVMDPRENFDGPSDPEKEHTIRWEDEILFYRNSEIRARARLVNAKLKPDLVLCLHFNAEAWDDPRAPKLSERDHLHLLISGAFLPNELEYDDVRFEMIRRLLSWTQSEELPLAEKAARAMARRTHLPPYQYTTENVTRVGTSGYVWLRNLIATRLYQCPVIYFEPYVMNSDEVFWREQEGDYGGIRNVNGTERPSIFREYADGVLDGLVEYYRDARGR